MMRKIFLIISVLGIVSCSSSNKTTTSTTETLTPVETSEPVAKEKQIQQTTKISPSPVKPTPIPVTNAKSGKKAQISKSEPKKN